MTDLDKAKYAAEMFASYEFQGITVWMVEETRTNYMVFGHTLIACRPGSARQNKQAEIFCECCGRYR